MSLDELEKVVNAALDDKSKIVGAFGFKVVGEIGHREQLIGENTFKFISELEPALVLRLIECVKRADEMRSQLDDNAMSFSRGKGVCDGRFDVTGYDKAREELE
jgi:hypothetical protein